jgi:membrane-associated phospholipid phosphatase
MVAEVRRHPRLRALVRSRLDPATETGLLLTAALGVLVASVADVGIVAEMVHAHRGLAPYDLSFANWVLLLLVVGGQFAVTNLIKFIVDRARPAVSQLTGFSGTSFPSGHAAAAAASYAVYALILGRRRSRTEKGVLGGAATAVAVAVAATRVLLGVHWFTDVRAGLLVGWAWFTLLSLAFGGRMTRFGVPVEQAKTHIAGVVVGASPPPTQAPEATPSTQ